MNKIPGILRVAVGVGVGAGVGAGAARARVCKRRQVTQIGSSQASQQAYRGRGALPFQQDFAEGSFGTFRL